MSYARSQLYTDVRRDAAAIQNIDDIVNRAVRSVVSEIDLRSMKRMAYGSPYIHEELFDYQAPSDLKEQAIIDIRRIEGRRLQDKFNLVTSEYFDRYKTYNKNLLTLESSSGINKLRISANLDETGKQVVLHTAEDIDANGTWAASGNASNLTEDTDMFINGEASLNFDMGASYTSGLLTNPDMDAVDLSDYETGGSVYVYVYIPSTTGLTSFKLRIGSSASAYFEKTVTTTNEALSFSVGWNLLRFDFSSATETGTVDMDNIDYLRLEIVGAGTASATTDWRLDYVVARRGIPHEVWYYSKYGWQSSAGTWLENSSAATDVLNADTEEYDLIVLKAKELVAEDLEFGGDEEDKFFKKYELKKGIYVERYPSERLRIKQTYYNFGSDLSDTMLS